MKKKIFIIAILIAISVKMHGQYTDIQANYLSSMFNYSLVEKSPNVAAFMKYGNYPVNNFTGLPQITIPIYTIKEKDFEMPIYMQYHAGGRKVDEIASWVGLGWNLAVGGVINREIRGFPDEYYVDFRPPMGDRDFIWRLDDEGFYTATTTAKGYLRKIDESYGSALTTANGMQQGWLYNFWCEDEDWCWCDSRGIDEHENYTGDTRYNDYEISDMRLIYGPFSEHIGKGYDTEPDVFRYNFNGYSGSFLFDYEDNIIQVPVTDLKIEKTSDLDNTAGKMDGFKITTPDGIVYFFEEIENSLNEKRQEEIPCNIDELEGFKPYKERYKMKYNSSWMLTKVVTLLGQIINFEYSEHIITMELPINKLELEWPGWNCDAEGGRDWAATYQNLMTIETKLLKKIDAPNVTVNFVHSTDYREDLTTSKYLSEINIYSNNTLSYVKQFSFDYDYFLTTKSGSSTEEKRLKLLSLQEYNDEQSKPAYTFYYNPTNLPELNSPQQDMFGYYNANGASHMIPKVYIYPDLEKHNRYRLNKISGYPDNKDGSGEYGQQYFLDGTDRTLNEDALEACMLTKIEYPTGGVTEFYYEPNDYYDNSVGENIYGGGLRVKKQISKGFSSSPNMTLQYSYKQESDGAKSSGMISNQPVFVHPIPSLAHPGYSYTEMKKNQATLFKNMLYRYSLNQNPLETAQGATVGYKRTVVDYGQNGTEEFYYSFPLSTNQDIDNTSFPGITFKRTQSLSKADMTVNDDDDETFLFRHQNEVSAVNDGFYYYGSYCPPFAPNPDYSFWRGLLLEKKIKDVNGGVAQQEIYTYAGIRSKPYPYRHSESEWFRRPPALKGYAAIITDEWIHSDAIFAFYNPYITNCVRLTDKYIRTYDIQDVSNQKYKETHEQYTYIEDNILKKDHLYPAVKRIWNSNNEILENTYKYPCDFSQIDIYKSMCNKNVLSPVVQQINCVDDGSGKKIINANFTEFGKFGSSVIKPKSIYKLNTPTPYSYDDFDMSQSNIDTLYSNNVELMLWVEESGSDTGTFTISSPAENEVVERTIELECVLTSSLCGRYTLVISGPVHMEYSSVGMCVGEYDSNHMYVKNCTEPIVLPPGNYTAKMEFFDNDDSTSDDCNNGYFAHFEIKASKTIVNSELIINNLMTVEKSFNYNSFGNVIEVKKSNDINTCYLWGYNKQYPIAKIENAAIDDIKSALNVTSIDFGSGGLNTFQESTLRTHSKLANAQITTYTYDPLIGMTSQTDPNGRTTYYEYDDFGRLEYIKDQDANIIKKYEYKYATQTTN